MNIQQATELTTHILNNNPKQAVMLWGAPGCGKSYAATKTIPAALGIPEPAVHMFRPSLHDPVDLTGLPLVTEDSTRWVTPDMLHAINRSAEEYGSAVFAIDEINQSVPMMFNALNGFLLDRGLAEFKLHDGVRIICTGNRQSDKAASNRMPTHTANRLAHIDIHSDLDGWVTWALGAGIPIWVIAFLKFKPELLNAFDPDKRENPTERTWEMFARAAGEDLPLHMTQRLAQSFVGEGAAAEVASFRQIMDDMPNPDGVLLNPDAVEIPESLGGKYAMAGALAQRASKGSIEAIMRYTSRMPKEFDVLCIRGAFSKEKSIASTRAFIEWSAKNAEVFLGL